MQLTPAEQGELNGMFEYHFGVNLAKGKNITVDLCDRWNDTMASYLLRKKLEKTKEKKSPPRQN